MKMSATYTDWDRIFPLTAIEGDLAFTLKGDLMTGWELTLPEAFGLIEDDYDSMIRSFASAIRALPDYTMMHRQDVYTKHPYVAQPQGSFLGDAYERGFAGREYLSHRAYLYLIQTRKARVLASEGSSSLFKCYPINDLPTAEQVGAFRASCDEFITTLKASGMIGARRLTEADYLGEDGVIKTVATLGEQSGLLCDVTLDGDEVGTNDKVLSAYTLADADRLPAKLRSVSRVEALSSSASQLVLGLGSALGLSYDGDHICNLYILKPNQKEVAGGLDSRRKKMTSMNKDRGNLLGSQEIDTYLCDIVRSGRTTVYAHCNMMAWSDPRDAVNVRSNISAALATMGVDAVRCKYDLPVLWYSALPGAACEIGQENLALMELDSSLVLGQYETFDRGFDTHTLKLGDRLTGKPLNIDLMSGAEKAGLIENWHAFVVGASGSGKSVFMNNNAYSRYALGGHVFIIDVGDSYEASCLIVNEESGGVDGVYNRWDISHPFSFNPFLRWREWINPDTDKLKRDEPSLDFLISVIKTIWTNKGLGWTDTMDAVLVNLITGYVRGLSEGDTPIFDDFYKWLRRVLIYDQDEGDIKAGMMRSFDFDGLHIDESRFDAIDFLASLSSYALGGQFGFLLNAREVKDIFKSRFTVFEVGKLKDTNNETFYSICILCIVNEFNRKMREVAEPKTMIIDEAWQAISNRTMAPYLRELWKTARKFLCSAIVVTQEVADITGSEVIKETILQNSPIKIVLNQSSNLNSFDKVALPLGLSDKDKNLILSMRSGSGARELFITWGGKKSGVYRHELCPEQLLAFESNKVRKAPLLDLAARKGSMLKAIEEIADDMRQKKNN